MKFYNELWIDVNYCVKIKDNFKLNINYVNLYGYGLWILKENYSNEEN